MKRSANAIKSFRHAFRGIGYALRGRNFRVQAFMGAVAIALGFAIGLSKSEWIAIVLAAGLVLALEATNTAVEEICNKFHPEEHPHIALIKDLGAGSVLLGAIAAAIVGIAVFGPYFIR